MLEVFSKFICAMFMSVAGYYIISSILEEQSKCHNNLRKIIILNLMSMMIVIINVFIKDTNIYSIVVFMINLLGYSKLFNLDLEKSTVVTGILTLMIFISEVIISVVSVFFFNPEQIMKNTFLYILINFFIMLLNILLIKNNKLQSIIKKSYYSVLNSRSILNIVFMMLLVLEISYITYSIAQNFSLNILSITNLIIMIVLVIITIIYLLERNNYNQLITEYDLLFSYIQNFEDWIEEEQLTRHEYKNQLAVIRGITNNKKVHSKIDEILDDYIKIEENTINAYKKLPKGGLKGLLYYKSIVAYKNNVDLSVDVGKITKKYINEITEKQTKILCRLIGIYFDNAIEASMEASKHKTLIEIYQIKDIVKIVISNTFNTNNRIDKRNNKGFSTKGKGRGKGLYFAKKIIAKNNDWLYQRQLILDDYYIQELNIKLGN